jgi:predicted ATPase
MQLLQNRLVLMLDNCHWADDASLDLIEHFLATSVCVVVCSLINVELRSSKM